MASLSGAEEGIPSKGVQPRGGLGIQPEGQPAEEGGTGVGLE